MTKPRILVTAASRTIGLPTVLHHTAAEKGGGTPPAQAWFAGGERVGYDPKARAIVAAQGAPLRVFLRREGDVAHAVSFLPGYPDGSFGWAKVHPHLPNATEMPKLFVEYVRIPANLISRSGFNLISVPIILIVHSGHHDHRPECSSAGSPFLLLRLPS